jgi:hypothetical protein
LIHQHGDFIKIILGRNQEENEVFQAVIPKGCWFAAYVKDPSSFALVGCTVAPGFDFEDFEMGVNTTLTKLYPEHFQIFKKFCRG